MIAQYLYLRAFYFVFATLSHSLAFLHNQLIGITRFDGAGGTIRNLRDWLAKSLSCS
jgi:hypothetical protein